MFSCNNSIIAGVSNIMVSGTSTSIIIGGSGNTMACGTYNSAIIGGKNLQLNNASNTVLVPNLQVNNSIASLSGGTMMSGVTGEYVFGTSNVTIVNGIIVSVV